MPAPKAMAVPEAVRQPVPAQAPRGRLLWDTERKPDDVRFREQYQLEEKLGEGTYGTVYKAVCRRTKAVLAVKRVKPEHGDEGVPSTAIREVAVLKTLRHPHVVRLIDVCCSLGKLELVFEYVPLNLKQHMRKYGASKEGQQGKYLEQDTVQSLMYQLMLGLDFCHGRRIVHRDLKPQNILVDQPRAGGPVLLKIADFGMARAFCVPLPRYTHEVVTTWYRAPEILFGAKEYSLPVDAWSAGCILGEMAAGSALFPAESEIHTIFRIFQKLGTPTEEEWPGLKCLPDFKSTFPQWKRKSWEDIRGAAEQLGEEGVQLVDGLLRYDPLQRLSAKASLASPYLARGTQRGAQPMEAEPTS